MDQRGDMTLPSLASYYVHQGMVESFMGLQTSTSMNPLSSATAHFQSNIGASIIGSTLPLGTSSTLSPHGVGVGPPAVMQGETVRRKRGRPRKYGQNDVVSLATSPSTSSPVSIVRPTQKRRGRPPGTGRKQQLTSLGGSLFDGAGTMTTRVFNVAGGEDVKRKILSISQGRHAFVMSCMGAVSAVTCKISSSGRTVTYEGRFDVLTLNGPYLLNGIGAPHHPFDYLSVMLAGPDGRVVGGVVEGAMIAAGPVQVVMGILVPRTSKTKNEAGDDLGTSGDPEGRAVGNLVPANI